MNITLLCCRHFDVLFQGKVKMLGQTSSDEAYFKKISQALAEVGAYQPTLVVDKQRLDHNIDQLMSVIDRGFDYRIVAKSLPSLPMLKYIMARTGTHKLMSFHMPFLMHVVESIPKVDILLGKPMPIHSVRLFYQWRKQKNIRFNQSRQLQWLVDNLERLKQYESLAKELRLVFNINLEIDIGLHRGGFECDDVYRQALTLIDKSKSLRLSGLMGYEPHIGKIPVFLGGSEKAFRKVKTDYRAFKYSIVDIMGEEALTNLTFNTGGSSTYPLYTQPDIMNEIATASALVKPTDFDVPSLKHHKNAAFIATPVLKVIDKPEIPMAKKLSKLMHTFGVLPSKSCFIYGGNWLAKPCYPSGSKCSGIFGHSSNQEMYDLPKNCDIKMDDFMFFRPTQSEAVFLQFGEVAVYDDGRIIDWWSVFEPCKLETTSSIKTNNSPE